jgi:hypothetical protein
MARAAALPVQHPTDRLVGGTPAIQALRAQIRHHRTVPGHGDDLLAAPGGGSAGAGRVKGKPCEMGESRGGANGYDNDG